MTVEPMDAVTQRRLASESLTYPEVGRTAGDLPDGYRHTVVRRELRGSTETFDRVSALVTSWQMHSRAGFDVAASHPTAVARGVVTVRRRLGPIVVVAPCRVVYVVDEPMRRGFAYGTLPGHPECGEEAFVVERDADGRVFVGIRAFSRASSALARASGPIGRWIQAGVTQRYLDVLDG